MASRLPRNWRFDADTCSFVTDDAVIRVVALRTDEAAQLQGAREQVEELYRGLFQRVNQPVARMDQEVADAFRGAVEPTEATQPARTILVFVDANREVHSDRVAAFTRVTFDGERAMVSPVAVAFEMAGNVQHQVLHATVLATEELAQAMAREALEASQPGQTLVIWRDQLGASDYHRNLLLSNGYLTALTERLEMTAYVGDRGEDTSITHTEVPGVEIRPLDFAVDDAQTVWDVLKEAFSPNPPSFEAWKRHYAQQPRFAPEMSAVAWLDGIPIAVSCIELIVAGEGGGDDEVTKVFETHRALQQNEATTASFTNRLEFAPEYKARSTKIRSSATVGYVCGIATLPAFRGKRLAHALLDQNFRAAARAGLDRVFLGTDRFNTAAVRAYERAGMVETKAEVPGDVTAKMVSVGP